MADPDTLIARQTELANYLAAGWPALGLPGLPPISCAAAVGNATRENEDRSVTVGPLDHGSNGLFQWRDSGPGNAARLSNMQAFGVKNFGTWEAIEPQAAFFVDECKRLYPALWADLIAGEKPLATLTLNITDEYEQPSDAGRVPDLRIKYATDFFASWKPGSPGTGLPQNPATVPSDPEITALGQIWTLLAPLSPAAISRIIAYVEARMNAKP